MATTTPNYGWRLPDANDFVTVAADISATVEDIDTELNRVDTEVSNDNIYGKLWRTSGTLNSPAAFTTLEFTSSRVRGGMTVHADLDGLILPIDGLYEVSIQAVGIEGTDPIKFEFQALRVRSAVADVAFNYTASDKSTGFAVGWTFADTVPLKASDVIRLQHKASSVNGKTFGDNEYSGYRLTVQYKQPLSGVTPI